MTTSVLIEKWENLAIVTLNRPEALNAFNAALRRELSTALGELNMDDDVRGLLITGAGDRSFSSGIDLKEAQGVQPDEIEAWFGEMCGVYQAIRMLDKPIVAALNGIAAGAGFQVGLTSDIRIGHPGTRMGQPEINAGIPSVMGSCVDFRWPSYKIFQRQPRRRQLHWPPSSPATLIVDSRFLDSRWTSHPVTT